MPEATVDKFIFRIPEPLLFSDADIWVAVEKSRVRLGLSDFAQRVNGDIAFAIDGCKLACAAKVVAESGGTVAHAIQEMDVYRRHRDLKPAGIAELSKTRNGAAPERGRRGGGERNGSRDCQAC